MTENKQDTITVELPISAEGEHFVSVEAVGTYGRDVWRKIMAGTNANPVPTLTQSLAPAVVAWIERDEWEPLPIPEVGRKIRATLRDGAVETFKVGKVETRGYPEWAYVSKAAPDNEARYIQRVRDVPDPGPFDITAWGYVDEPAVDLAAIADKIAAAVNELREAIG